MNKAETAKILALLKEHADNKTMTPETVEYWAIALDDIPYPAALAAYKHWIRTKKWMPKPSEIRDLVDEKVFGIPSPESARAQAERAIRENYPGHPVKYTPDKLVLDALRTIGGAHMFRNAQSARESESLWSRFAVVYDDLRRERVEAIDYAAEYAALQSGTSANVKAIA